MMVKTLKEALADMGRASHECLRRISEAISEYKLEMHAEASKECVVESGGGVYGTMRMESKAGGALDVVECSNEGRCEAVKKAREDLTVMRRHTHGIITSPAKTGAEERLLIRAIKAEKKTRELKIDIGALRVKNAKTCVADDKKIEKLKEQAVGVCKTKEAYRQRTIEAMAHVDRLRSVIEVLETHDPGKAEAILKRADDAESRLLTAVTALEEARKIAEKEIHLLPTGCECSLCTNRLDVFRAKIKSFLECVQAGLKAVRP